MLGAAEVAKNGMRINARVIGADRPVFIVAELSANHNQTLDGAVRLIHAAKEAGADAVKLQTYTPDTITLDCDNEYFLMKSGMTRGATSLHELYRQAYTPWEWQPKLKELADDLGLDLFSTPFDPSAVDFLEEMGVPAYKIASFEIIDLPLIRRVARTGKPVILSTGMATLDEIREAVQVIQDSGGSKVALLKCTSAYPAAPGDMNLRTIPHLRQAFDLPVGLSDHSLELAVPVAAVALGACIVEKHLTLSRSIPGPDSSFSLEPQEFKRMVRAVRAAEEALGRVRYGPDGAEVGSSVFRKSLFVVEDVQAGDVLTERNVRSIRPGHGLHTRYLEQVLGRRAACDVRRGTPLSWNLIA